MGGRELSALAGIQASAGEGGGKQEKEVVSILLIPERQKSFQHLLASDLTP